MRYLIFDLETENHTVYKRFSSPFVPQNYVVARGWKLQGDTQCSWEYFTEPHKKYLHIPDDVTLLVGHNIKFDLMYEWANPELQAFFKRGGRIWDTQYAEYLIEAMAPNSHMVAMDDIVERYGGRLKINAVKELWEMGMLTSQIDKDLLIDYLVGTEEEQRNSGDIGNTELIFLGQVAKATERGMVNMIFARMDGLCATTEMEFNGLKIDVQEAGRRTKILEEELVGVEDELKQYIPELPEELEFNWASPVHVSCLIFGGTLKYQKQAPYMDENGEFVRKKAKADWPVFNGEPVDPETPGMFPEGGLMVFNDKYQDTYTSGKKKGSPKFKSVEVQGELRVKYQDFFIDLPGYATPNPKWKSKLTNGAGHFVYSTAADIIEELGSRDIPFLKALAKRQNIVKDLGTYYVRYDPKTKDYVGMLTCVMPESHLIHHSLNHVSTVTSRLSSSNPNLQNIPRGDTSEVKKMFCSRFGSDGVMLEADYSQLEVVIQGMLSGDENLCQDLRDRIDFHCKRVSAKYGCTYAEALFRCKDESFPDHKTWKKYRTGCKEFSFQRAYGAGAAKISETTGIPLQDVKDLIDAEERMYPGVTVFNAEVEQAVKNNAVPFRDPTRGFRTFRRGWWQSPTGTRYSFRSNDAPAFLKEKGIQESFSPTELKNYPIQGTGGEVVQIILGRLWRHFVAHDNYGGLALLCNTVHDCVWIDVHNSVLDSIAPEVKRIMESVPEALNTLYGMDVTVPFPVELEIGPNLYDKHILHIA